MKRREFIAGLAGAAALPLLRGTVGDQVGRGQGERHPQGRQQEGRKAQGAAGKAKSK